MRAPCRFTLILLALVAFVTFAAHGAHAQSYPTRPLRLIVPFPPGGTADIIGRPLAQRLRETLGQSVVVDNRGGAGGVVGTALVAKSPPDGYTLLLGANGSLTISPNLGKLPYDPLTELTPIGTVATGQFLLAVHPSVPARNVDALVKLARSRPGTLRFGSAGSGNPGHLAGELFKSIAGVNMIHIPYKGAGPMSVELMAGQVDLGFAGVSSFVPHVQAGRVRALAVTSLRRSDVLPELPTLNEAGLVGYEVSTFWGVLTAARLPREMLQRLSVAVTEAARHPELRDMYIKGGNDPATSTPDEFAARLRTDIAKWGAVIRTAGIKEE